MKRGCLGLMRMGRVGDGNSSRLTVDWGGRDYRSADDGEENCWVGVVLWMEIRWLDDVYVYVYVLG